MTATAGALQAPPATAPAELTLAAKILAFATMSVGFFIALLDIQIVSASLANIAGGLSAGPDEIAWVQTSSLRPQMRPKTT
jgi:MFS transporter, DHA2 family, multidrug resistance protein